MTKGPGGVACLQVCTKSQSTFHDQSVVSHVHKFECNVIVKVLFSGSRFNTQMNLFCKVSRQKHRHSIWPKQFFQMFFKYSLCSRKNFYCRTANKHFIYRSIQRSWFQDESVVSQVHKFEENGVRGFMIKAWCQILQVYIKSWPRFHV